MLNKRNMTVAAVAVAVAAGVAIAGSEIGKHSEKKIALTEVPQAAMEAARTQLSAISQAELVTTKDGRTLYEIKGKRTADGKTVELFVGADGQVQGTEN